MLARLRKRAFCGLNRKRQPHADAKWSALIEQDPVRQTIVVKLLGALKHVVSRSL